SSPPGRAPAGPAGRRHPSAIPWDPSWLRGPPWGFLLWEETGAGRPTGRAVPRSLSDMPTTPPSADLEEPVPPPLERRDALVPAGYAALALVLATSGLRNSGLLA